MPLLQIKNQPYFPDTDAPNNYNCGTEQYCHPINDGDNIYTQFYQTPCEANELTDPTFSDTSLGVELLTNGSFTGNANGWETTGGVLPSNGWAYDSNNIEHTPGTQEVVFQDGITYATGYYQVEIDITRVSGSVAVQLGNTVGSPVSVDFDETGVHTAVLYYGFGAPMPFIIIPNATDDFDGTINSVSLKLISYGAWTPTAGWTLSDGQACHTTGSTTALTESVANYILDDGYYSIKGFISGYISGTLQVMISNVLAGTVSSNGVFHFYGTPTADGVISFIPSTDFIGCISFPETDEIWWGVRALRNDYLMELVDADGNRFDISNDVEYYEKYVTLIFNFATYEIANGCFTIEALDRCLVEGNNLIVNGNFQDGSANWILNNGGGQYEFTGGTAAFKYNPVEGSNYIDNGDFATNDFTDWTAGANWSAATGKAVHTPGSTATLVQSVTIPPPTLPPTSYLYLARITMSNRTAGYVTMNLGDTTNTVQLATNGILMISLHPTTSGAVDFTITPSSTFDGEIDDVELFYTNVAGWSATPIMTSDANTDMVAGNYEVEFDIVSQSDPRIQVAAILLGGSLGYTFFSGVGTHTFSVPNYVPGAQQLRLYGNFQISNYQIDGEIVIDNVVVRRVEPFEATYTSECLNYQDTHSRTMMLVGYCDQPAFGFEFENTGFKLQQRVGLRSFAPTWPTDTIIQRSGTGNSRVVYAAVEKLWQLHTVFASETFHNAMAVIIRCDHFLIGEGEDNGKEYVVQDGDYSPEWVASGAYSLAPVMVLLRIKEAGQVFNRHL